MGKIFGIGLGKTGTSSLCEAMQILGFRSAHYCHDILLKMENYDFACDMPVITRYKKLDEMYPGSKFIFTVRKNTKGWLKSCKLQYTNLPLQLRPKQLKILTQYRLEQWGITSYKEEIFKKKYDEHQLEVMDYFRNRPNDLLIMDICAGDGWEILCPFVGKKNPTVSFPHANKFLTRKSKLYKLSLKRMLSKLATKN